MVKVGWLLFALAIAAALLALGSAAGDEGPGLKVGLAGRYDISGNAYAADGSGRLVVLRPDGDGVGDNADTFPETVWLHAWWQFVAIVLAVVGLLTIIGFTIWSQRAIGFTNKALRYHRLKGVRLNPARETLRRARRARRRLNYPASVALAKKALAQCEALAGEHRQFSQIVKRLRIEVATLRDEGVVVSSVSGELEKLEAALSGGKNDNIGVWSLNEDSYEDDFVIEADDGLSELPSGEAP